MCGSCMYTVGCATLCKPDFVRSMVSLRPELCALLQDPNWQDMLSEELQRAEEELNNWSLFGRAKIPGPSCSEVSGRVPSS